MRLYRALLHVYPALFRAAYGEEMCAIFAQRRRARFLGAVHEAVQADGPVRRLSGDLLHYVIETPAEHAAKVETYATITAQELFRAGKRTWLLPMLLVPPWTLVQEFILCAGLLDGWRGRRIARMSGRYAWLKYRTLGELVRNAKS